MGNGSSGAVNLPAGFELEAPASGAPNLPPGFELEGSSQPDVAHQPVSAKGVAKTLGTKEGVAAAADPLVGFVKGLGDTVHGTGELIRKGLNTVDPSAPSQADVTDPNYVNHPEGLGDKVIPRSGQSALSSASESSNGAQWTGKALENIAEFMTGEGAVDEAGKALDMSGKIQKLGDVAKFLEKHPYLAKMLATGVKTGIVSGAQTTAKTGSPTEGAEGAAVGGIVGGTVGPALEGGFKYIRDAYKPAVDMIDPTTGLKDVKNIQAPLQKGIRAVAAKAAQDAGVAAPNPQSLRDVFAGLGDGVKGKAQPVFDAVDQASNREFSNAQAAARKYSGALDKAGKDAFEAAIQKQNDLFDKFVKGQLPTNGKSGMQFSPQDLDNAKAMWKQYRAIQQVDDAVNRTVVGQRPEIAAGATSKQPLEEIPNPKRLLGNLNQLYRDGTLETALGKDGAHAIMRFAGDGQQGLEDIMADNRKLKAVNEARNQMARDQNTEMAGRRKVIGGTIALGALGSGVAAATDTGKRLIKSAFGGE